MMVMQIEKPKVIDKKLAKQYRKAIRTELLDSVKGDTWENSSACRGRTWNEYIQYQVWFGITDRLVWNKEFCSIAKLVNDEYKILPPFENYYINQLNRKSGSNQAIANAAAQSLKFRWPWRAWKEERASFSPAAVERQIVNMLSEIADKMGLKIKMAFVNGERRVGCPVENKDKLRLGTLGKLDRMALNEFRWLSLSEQKELIKEGRIETKKIGEITANDATVREALGKRGISVESGIVEKRKGKFRNGFGLAFNRHEKIYKQISVVLEIPGMNNGESLTIYGKRHAYESIHLIAKNSLEVSGSHKTWLRADSHGNPDPYYNLTEDRSVYHTYKERDRKITHTEYDFKEIKLTGIAINGNLLSGSVQKNPIRDFFEKLFGGSQHIIEVGCCALAEKGGKLYIHYEKLQARVPRNETA